MALQHIMLDNETLGTRADSVIMSIGAVKFDPYSTGPGSIDPEGFYASVSIDSNHEAAQRHICESTVMWWMEQQEEAKRVFREPKTTLWVALQDLAHYFNHSDYEVWSNGADFDIPMLAHAYETNGLTIPWKFYNTNCFRTLKKMPFARNVPKVVQDDKHHALSDAIFQAQRVQAYFAELKKQTGSAS